MNVYVLGDSISYISGSWVFQLADKLPCDKVYNLARGGATYGNRDQFISYTKECGLWNMPFHPILSEDGKTESYPANYDAEFNNPIDCGITNPISNQIAYMNRLIDEFHHPMPDVIIIACGVNDAHDALIYSDERFNRIVSRDIHDLSEEEMITMAYGIHYALGILKELYPKAKLIISTPIPSNYSFLRPIIPNVSNWLNAFGAYYQIPVIDGFGCGINPDNEKGALDFEYKPNNPGVYLYDGLHPNMKGNLLLGDYFSKELKKILF